MDPRALVLSEAPDAAPALPPSAPRPYLHLDHLQLGGATDRFQRNLDALRLLHDLEQTGRQATRAEQTVLAHFSAFGDSQQLGRLMTYNGATKRYEVAPAYRSFLSEHALRSLRTASLTAFYTPLDVIRVLWDALLGRGLQDIAEPRILEPACGVGAFLTAMPPALRARAHITAVELDRCAAVMAGHIHPDITLHAGLGYETINVPDASFDLAISNVPFGAIPVLDRELPPAFTRTVHDYFLGKTLRVVRPGGLIVFLTSWGTLDKASATVRRLVHAETELLGAFRLPSGVFEETSGSSSGADLLILRKRVGPVLADEEPRWLQIAPVDYPRISGGQHLTHGSRYTSPVADDVVRRAQRIHVNQHWIDHPASVIGTARVIDQDTSLWLQVSPPSAGTARTLAAALDRELPPTLWQTPDATALAVANAPSRVRAAPAVPRSLTEALDQMDARERPQFEALADIYTTAKGLLAAELAGAADDVVAQLRAALNRRYDGFVARWGVLSHPRLTARLRRVPELRFVQALETNARSVTVDRWRADKAAIFTTRTVRPQQAVLPGTLTVDEALACSLNERGGVDLDRIAFLSGVHSIEVLEALGERIFLDPATRRYETADAYLSGDVRVKLQQAQRAATTDARYARNVAALTAVQPAPLSPAEIMISPAAIWLPEDVLTAFVQHLLPAFSGRVRFTHGLAAWTLSDPDNHAANSVEATSKWGTRRANAVAILQATLDNQPVTIYDEIIVDGAKRRVFNATETVAAQDKQAAIRAAFTEWIWSDAARAERLCAIYNTRFNSVRLRRYDGSHLRLPGMNTTLLRAGDLDPYQKDGVWQILQNKTTLVSFDTGGGKTWTTCTAIMESIRLGQASKALIVVPNNLVGQWAAAFQDLYPAANVLAMTPDDFEAHQRGVALSRIATGSWDAVIIGETSLKFLPIGAPTVTTFREAETDQLRSYLEELRATARSRDEQRSFRQIQLAVDTFETRLAGMEQRITRDSAQTITWEELGIDMFVMDEAQAVKNLWIPSRLNVPGVPKGGSQRALDCHIKTWDLLRRGAKVVFLTATPVMNSIAEVYVMQRYLQQDALDAAGIPHFDAWVSLFGEIAAAFEMKPDGSGFRMHTRLRAFVNMPDLAAMWRQCLNVRTKAEMQLPEPTLVTDKPIPVAVPASPALNAYVRRLAERAEAIRNGRVPPHQDNMLLITSQGRKAALDLRLALPGIPRQRHSKIDALVARMVTLYTTFAPLRGTQLVFCDLATPKGRTDREATRDAPAGDAAAAETETAEERHSANFVYHEIKAELVKRGIPADEIAFIHDYDQPARKAALFAAMNNGRMRILIGSTAKMSTGMNVQERLIGLHHLDCPWRPGDLHQRDGRIERQGNIWPQVYVFRYITEGSFDGYSWQTIETKARFIEQIMSGTLTQRRIDDVSEFVLSAAEVKAIASGNPLVLRKVVLELELSRMDRVRAVHERTRYDLGRQRAWVLRQQEQDRQEEAHQRRALAAITGSTPFRVELCRSLADARQRVITKRADADQAIWQVIKEARTALEDTHEIKQCIGRYRGLEIWLSANAALGFSVALWLAFEDAKLCRFFASAEISAFRSADGQLREIEERITKLQQWQADRVHEIAAIDAELARLTEWEGQAAYDTADAELRAINVQFAELEEAETADNPAPTPKATDAGTASDDEPWYDEVRRLALLGADDGTADERPISLPPATESLAFMAEVLAQPINTAAVVPVPVPPTAAEQLATQLAPIAVIAMSPRSPKGQVALPHPPQQFAWDF